MVVRMTRRTRKNHTSIIPPPNAKVTYSEIVAQLEELARTCDNNQALMRTLLCNMNTMIEHVRDGHGIQIHFDGEDPMPISNSMMPRSAIARPIANAVGVKKNDTEVNIVLDMAGATAGLLKALRSATPMMTNTFHLPG